MKHLITYKLFESDVFSYSKFKEFTNEYWDMYNDLADQIKIHVSVEGGLDFDSTVETGIMDGDGFCLYYDMYGVTSNGELCSDDNINTHNMDDVYSIEWLLEIYKEVFPDKFINKQLEVHKFKEKIIRHIKSFFDKMKINEFNLVKITFNLLDSSEHYDMTHELTSIDKDFFISIDNTKIKYEDVVTIDILDIEKHFEERVKYTYEFQKYIIENEPTLIPDILHKLNDRIKEEYPHLGYGKDLNLL